MRLLRSLVVPFCIVPALAAQTPAPSPARGPRVPLPVSRAVSADLAAARDHTARLLVEPLVFGRVSVGFSGSFTDQAEVPWYPYPIMYAADPYPGAPCPPNCYGPPTEPDYQAWSIDLNLRWYPALLSLNTPQAKAMLYVGEFIGFTQRRATNTGYIYCPVCAEPVPLDSGVVVPNDSVIGGPYPYPYPRPGPYPNTQTFEAIEPGVEAGVRIQASRQVFFDIGGRWRLVRVDDPYSTKRPGDVDPRLVVSAGLSW
jgi:hypothetical protein